MLKKFTVHRTPTNGKLNYLRRVEALTKEDAIALAQLAYQWQYQEKPPEDSWWAIEGSFQ